jgi:hypothetical protein
MMRIKLPVLAAALLVGFGSAGRGQPPAEGKDANKPAAEKKPSQLEESIAQALRDNPDVRVAEAKVREAEAELNRTRLQVIQKVVGHQHTIETLENAIQAAEANYQAAEAKLKSVDADLKRMANLGNVGVAKADLDLAQANREQARANLEAAKAALQSAKADLAKAQAELPYLLGKATKDDPQSAAIKRLAWLKYQDDGANLTARSLAALALAGQPPQGTVADKLHRALDTPISLRVADKALDEVLRVLQDRSGVSLVVASLPQAFLARKLILGLDDVALGAAFQAVEDVAGVQFGVRDYGILVSERLPPGVTRLHDFWKDGAKKK